VIKQIWTIRSRYKLFIGLSFAIAGVILGYSALNLTVLPETILWNDGEVSKYALLVIPVFSLLLCVGFYLLSRRLCGLWSEMFTACCFLQAMFLAFLQLRYLNIAKGIPRFSDLILVLTGAAFFIAVAYYPIRIFLQKHHSEDPS
jgi:hypothetical protein